MAFDAGRADDAILAHGMERTLRRWRKALARAKREKEPGEAFHDLRKAVKAHGAQLALLRDMVSGAPGRRRRAVDALGERLGELNDIADMRARLKAGEDGFGNAVARPFTRLLKRHARRLARKSRRQARCLLRSAPERPALRTD